MEVTKCLKPLGSRHVGDGASVRAATRVNAEQASKRTMCRPSRQRVRRRLIRLGEMSEDCAQLLHRGSGGSTYMKESVRNTGSPTAWSGMTNRTPARDRPGAVG